MSVARNGLRASAGARVGCAAMSQDGQGVGTEPICKKGEILPMQGSLPRVGKATHEAALARVDEGLGREPFPHERARRAVVHRVYEAPDVVVHYPSGIQVSLGFSVPSEPQKTRRAGVECTLELELVRRPALLQRHNVRHSLASTDMPVKRSERQKGPGSWREGGDAS